jgi:hypothetical protein
VGASSRAAASRAVPLTVRPSAAGAGVVAWRRAAGDCWVSPVRFIRQSLLYARPRHIGRPGDSAAPPQGGHRGRPGPFLPRSAERPGHPGGGNPHGRPQGRGVPHPAEPAVPGSGGTSRQEAKPWRLTASTRWCSSGQPVTWRNSRPSRPWSAWCSAACSTCRSSGWPGAGGPGPVQGLRRRVAEAQQHGPVQPGGHGDGRPAGRDTHLCASAGRGCLRAINAHLCTMGASAYSTVTFWG